MADIDLQQVLAYLQNCPPEQQRAVFDALRGSIDIHPLERSLGAPAEVILEAINRGSDLTQRMFRGVMADAAFAAEVVPMLSRLGWRDVTPVGNWSYDYMLQDQFGPVTVQIKLQRSTAGQPTMTTGRNYGGFTADMYLVEPQKTRKGDKRDAEEGEGNTRPYRYGEFDILAVAMRPSTGRWSDFRYTVANWLLPGPNPGEIAKYQPVPQQPNGDWTDDFGQAAAWLRSGQQRRIGGGRGVVGGMPTGPAPDLFS